jgi:hypothetical protein
MSQLLSQAVTVYLKLEKSGTSANKYYRHTDVKAYHILLEIPVINSFESFIAIGGKNCRIKPLTSNSMHVSLHCS